MKYLLPFVALLIFSCTSKPTTEFGGDLVIGTQVQGTLEKETPKSYAVSVSDNTYLSGYVDQLSVDVVVTLYDAQDEVMGVFDNPAEGPEPFNFSIEDGGDYRLEVSPFEEGSGDYSLLIQTAEPIATDPTKRMDQLMTMYSGDAPGGVIGVIENGELVFSKAYGKANLTHDLDFKLNTPTNIGSVSKQFTAYAILLLEARGQLSIEDDIRKHFPELPDFGDTITLVNLMNHTNGLREVYNLMPIAGWYGEDKLLRSEALNIVKKQTELQNPVNSEFNYNNTAFIMLAELVSKTTDTVFPEWMHHNVFKPLGMNDTYVRKDPAQIIPNASQGYSLGEDGYIENRDLDAAYGAGGIYTTPEDFAKWMGNFSNPKVGTAAMIAKMSTPRILTKGDTLNYGFGIGVGEHKGLTQLAHSGADIAHRAMMRYYPDLNSGVVAFSNNASFSSGQITNDLATLFFADDMEKEEVEDEAEESSEAVSEDFSMDPQALEKFIGKFKMTEAPMIIEFTAEDGVLSGEPTGQRALELKPTNDSTFVNNEIPVTISFKVSAEGQVDSAVLAQGGGEFNLERLPPYSPGLDELREYTGKYFSEELEVFYRVQFKDSSLVARMRNFDDIELTTSEKDKFGSNTFFIAEMEFQRDESGAITGFTVSNGRTKGIAFDKQ